jgi:hypothetical protein
MGALGGSAVGRLVIARIAADDLAESNDAGAST